MCACLDDGTPALNVLLSYAHAKKRESTATFSANLLDRDIGSQLNVIYT